MLADLLLLLLADPGFATAGKAALAAGRAALAAGGDATPAFLADTLTATIDGGRATVAVVGRAAVASARATQLLVWLLVLPMLLGLLLVLLLLVENGLLGDEFPFCHPGLPPLLLLLLHPCVGWVLSALCSKDLEGRLKFSLPLHVSKTSLAHHL